MGKLKREQSALFDIDPDWRELWKGMPEYYQEDLMPWHSIKINFANEADMKAFAKLIDQNIYYTTKSTWFPVAPIAKMTDKQFVSSEPIIPDYPLYIISKGRWDSRLTSKALEKLGLPYHIVIEPQEYNQYAAVIDPDKILTLPFSNLGQGSIPARNWVWEHSIERGFKRHWILDDNIEGFYRLYHNIKIPVKTGGTFYAIEQFVDRYKNIALSGMNYFMFAKRKDDIPPIVMNTRIYSCILLSNELNFRWRGRYNEDTDLSIRILKAGYCTVLFNAFLAFKETTLTMTGGNSDELYKGVGRLKMAQSLQKQHPDIVTVTEKWGRPQHQVDYSVFKNNALILKDNIFIPDKSNEYGMRLEIKDAT